MVVECVSNGMRTCALIGFGDGLSLRSTVAPPPARLRHLLSLMRNLAMLELLDLPADVLSQALIVFLSLGDASSLRAASVECRELVAAAPLCDAASVVRRLPAWRRAFPRARAVGLSPAAAAEPALATFLCGVTRVVVAGTASSLDPDLAVALSTLSQLGRRQQRRLLLLPPPPAAMAAHAL